MFGGAIRIKGEEVMQSYMNQNESIDLRGA